MKLICWLFGHRWVDRRRTTLRRHHTGKWYMYWRATLWCRCKRCGHILRQDKWAFSPFAGALTYICGGEIETSP